MQQPEDSNPSDFISLRLHLENDSRKSITARLHDERLIIGRADEGDTQPPDLDLTPFGASQNGVSRMHGALTAEGNIPYIQDLNSSNGTRINGFQLPPEKPYRLRDGDELELGSLRLIVRLSR